MSARQPLRMPVPAKVEKQLLTKSRRRCPLCFHLENDTRQKRGQIAHLDRRRSNSIQATLPSFAWTTIRSMIQSRASTRTTQLRK